MGWSRYFAVGLLGVAWAVVDDSAARRDALNKAMAEEWEFELQSQPEFATVVGDMRYNDRLGSLSPQALDAQTATRRDFLRRLEAIDTAGLGERDELNKRLLARDLRERIAVHDLKLDRMPFTQFDGPHLELGYLPSICPFRTAKDYENYAARLRQIPRALDEAMELAQSGERAGLMPPRYLLEKVAVQAKALGAAGPRSPFVQPLAQFPAAMPEPERTRLRKEVTDAVDRSAAPAYLKLARFVKESYAPHGRTEEGAWALPNGRALYAFLVRQMTTTDLTPERIHEIGLKQVAEIEGQIAALKKAGPIEEKYASSREQILDLYRKYTDEMYARVPRLFGRLPKARLTIVPVEAYREKDAASAEYMPGTPDGSRKGQVKVNTSDYSHRALDEIEATAYHEGVPGHHFQISIAQETPGLPPFRQHEFYTAFVEGWALYAEGLGKEAGLYQSRLSDYGRLKSDLFRAIRLVVDTGVHEKRWTRQQMVDYFHRHSTVDEPSVRAEVDRYIALPGQALAYKIGQLKILELRGKAEAALGARFDVRKFHDAVLGGGALPLDVLEARMNEWMARQ